MNFCFYGAALATFLWGFATHAAAPTASWQVLVVNQSDQQTFFEAGLKTGKLVSDDWKHNWPTFRQRQAILTKLPQVKKFFEKNRFDAFAMDEYLFHVISEDGPDAEYFRKRPILERPAYRTLHEEVFKLIVLETP